MTSRPSPGLKNPKFFQKICRGSKFWPFLAPHFFDPKSKWIFFATFFKLGPKSLGIFRQKIYPLPLKNLIAFSLGIFRQKIFKNLMTKGRGLCVFFNNFFWGLFTEESPDKIFSKKLATEAQKFANFLTLPQINFLSLDNYFAPLYRTNIWEGWPRDPPPV